MKTCELDGKTYIASTQDDGTITLMPVGEAHEPERKGRCGDVHPAASCGYYVNTGEADGLLYLASSQSLIIHTDHCYGYDREPLFNIYDVANGEYVRKEDVVAALSIRDEDDECMFDMFDMGSFEFAAREVGKALDALGIVRST